jgi:hypothetical protein
MFQKAIREFLLRNATKYHSQILLPNFKVYVAVSLKIFAFWDKTPCLLVTSNVSKEPASFISRLMKQTIQTRRQGGLIVMLTAHAA